MFCEMLEPYMALWKGLRQIQQVGGGNWWVEVIQPLSLIAVLEKHSLCLLPSQTFLERAP